jgi:hypothetical protein
LNFAIEKAKITPSRRPKKVVSSSNYWKLPQPTPYNDWQSKGLAY